MLRSLKRLGVYEDEIAQLLKTTFATERAEVIDRSGGCGESYEVIIESTSFKNMSTIKQHRMVQEVIREEIKKWHAVSIKTSEPKS